MKLTKKEGGRSFEKKVTDELESKSFTKRKSTIMIERQRKSEGEEDRE